MNSDLKDRCYRFSLEVVKYLKRRNWTAFELIAAKQLMRAATSAGANVAEGRNSSSRMEFKRYYEIALKSGNESKYWLCLLRDGFDAEATAIRSAMN